VRYRSVTVNNGQVEQEDAPLSVLKKPSQARSLATFANILDAATDIILERGVKGLNTNLVAERAGINIGTLYHYFPNKNAILSELFGIQQSRRDDVLFEKLDALPDTPDVRRWTTELFEIIRQLRAGEPTTLPLRRAFNSVPELAELDRVATNRYAEHLAGLLSQRFAGIEPRQGHAMANLLIAITLAVLDSPMVEGVDSECFITEAVRLVGAYADELER
jgi:AcrR family transcriptional regulator